MNSISPLRRLLELNVHRRPALFDPNPSENNATASNIHKSLVKSPLLTEEVRWGQLIGACESWGNGDCWVIATTTSSWSHCCTYPSSSCCKGIHARPSRYRSASVPREDSSLEGRSEKATTCRPSIMVAVFFESYIYDTPKSLNKNNDQVDYKGINKVVQ